MKRKRIEIENLADDSLLPALIDRDTEYPNMHFDFLDNLNQCKNLGGLARRDSLIISSRSLDRYRRGTCSILRNTSLELFQLTGEIRMTMEEAKQWVMDYATRNDLIDDHNYITCDDNLRTILLKPRILISQLRTYLRFNLYRTGQTAERKLRKHIISHMKHRVSHSNLEGKMYMSDALSVLLNHHEPVTMSQATKMMWDYIKQNGLLVNKRIVLNDGLKKLFVCEDVIGSVNLLEKLKDHLSLI